MLKLFFIFLVPVIASLQLKAEARHQVLVTGNNAQEVQENAFKKDMDYPISPLKCSQRCSQWWERE